MEALAHSLLVALRLAYISIISLLDLFSLFIVVLSCCDTRRTSSLLSFLEMDIALTSLVAKYSEVVCVSLNRNIVRYSGLISFHLFKCAMMMIIM